MMQTLIGAATLIGTIVGVGIFGIPYVISQSGYVVGMVQLIIISFIVTLTMLYLGEIALRTRGSHHLIFYAEKYIGPKGKKAMFLAFAFGVYATILAYIIGAGESLSFLFFNSNEHILILGAIFWAVLSVICYFGIKALEKGEFIGVAIIILIVLAISIISAPHINLENLAQSKKEFKNYLAPFGVLVFAFMGYATIPEVKRILKNGKNKMKRTIILSIILVTLTYAVFTTIVIGLKGSTVTQLATISLGRPFIILGIFTILTSYLAYSIAFIDVLHLDLNITKNKSWLYTIIIPIISFLILNLLNAANFSKVLGIGGAISGSLTIILIFLMVEKAKYLGDRKPEYQFPSSKILTWILSIVFLLGSIIEITNAF